MSGKSGGKNKKYGRNKVLCGVYSAQNRKVKNKAKKIEREERRQKAKRAKDKRRRLAGKLVERGTARKLRRRGGAIAQTASK